MTSCVKERGATTLFQAVPSSASNVTFNNTLEQTKDFNIIEYLYFYNGGGVSIGDINNDGLDDLYFTSNQGSNKLYLNKSNFEFKDITDEAGVGGDGNWKTGTAMADVNGDGYLDIFVCGVGNYKKFNGRNQLFINNGDLTFTDRTIEYGLAFEGFSTHAAFFDYDNDGDLDMYLLNHSVHTARSYGHSRIRHQSDRLAGDKLYRNELVPSGQPHFTEVTSRAGIYNSQVAYGLGVGISDLNGDGFMDIYVSNDFHENDYLYINQGDGTFKETISSSIPHVSRFSMGNDIADINNDSRPDIITLDMLPRDEEVIKTTAGEEPYDIYHFKLRFGYHHQFARNALQLNRGEDHEGNLLFSDIAPLAGVEASDWSWAPLLADFDNDGHKDLFIANGILTRPNDLDYINFIATDSAQRYYGYETFIENMPSGKVPNVFFRNAGNLQFEDVSATWTGNTPSLSTGAAYADLDNDGDLDLVVNNINEEVSLYRNNGNADGTWLKISFQGTGANRFGIGAKVIVYAADKVIWQEQMLSRGWQSSVSPIMHVGVGFASIDSVTVIWPDGKYQTLTGIGKDKHITVQQVDAISSWNYDRSKDEDDTLLRAAEAPFIHRENEFNAFAQEKLIPHMISTQGPALAVGDVNSDGRDDFFGGGAAGHSGELYLQNIAGEFVLSSQAAFKSDPAFEDTDAAFFDADGNGRIDLLVVSGGQQWHGKDELLSPRLYLNNASGDFERAIGNLPEIFVDASCIEVTDVDADGDADVFIGGRVIAGRYGEDPDSYLLINDGRGAFKDESMRLRHDWAGGMVTDAVWNDINGDGRIDLIAVGEWMPVTVLIQDGDGNFLNKTRDYGLEKTEGWWNTIHACDVDGDRDTDFVAGNLGVNSRLRATPDQPVSLFAGDMDRNGGMDHLLTYYNQGEQHPFISRDQLV
ncbi:MAG TPA: VCBS repeat-containing protein, partial [Chryseosolibacter sp.]|nr:VCBS repeat-containing protein [Chryseosolibacter sp.]